MRLKPTHPLSPSTRLKPGGRKAITSVFRPGDKVSQLVRAKRSRCTRRHHKVAIVLYSFGQCVVVRYKNRPKELYPAWVLILAPQQTAIAPGGRV